jgi:Tol biopolymer transport system component
MSDPAWAPDGRKLAFSGPGGILVQDEGGRTRSVASPGNHNDHPDWSPDGRRIAFDAGAYGGQIYTIAPNGSNLRQLTNPDIFVFDENPDWSPDGTTIVFEERGPRSRGLFTIDAGGRSQSLLAANGSDPAWSPDGASVVFVRYSPYGTESDLFIADSEGSGERRLTSEPGNETEPAWSPDGSWIAFDRWTASQGDVEEHGIWLIRPDGTHLHSVLGGAFEFDPAWRPRAPRRPGPQRPCMLRGTARGDVIHGTALGDLILAGAGRDSVAAGGGNDLVDAGPGADYVTGGRGSDVLGGGLGSDRLLGGAGADWLYSNDNQTDVVNGNGGRDWAYPDSLDRLISIERLYP